MILNTDTVSPLQLHLQNAGLSVAFGHAVRHGHSIEVSLEVGALMRVTSCRDDGLVVWITQGCVCVPIL